MHALYFYLPAMTCAVVFIQRNIFDTVYFSKNDIGKRFQLVSIEDETIAAVFIDVTDSAKPRKLLKRFVPNIEELTIEHTYEILEDLTLKPTLNDPQNAGRFYSLI